MEILYILGGLIGLFFIYVLFLVICSFTINPKKEYMKNSPFFRFLLHSATTGALFFLRVRIHAMGVERVPQGERVVFVGNHRSNYDPIVQWQVFRKWQIAFISKKENFKIPIFGRFIRKCCFMAIDRENPRNALKTIQKAIDLLLAEEVSIGVYPEGTRSKEGVLLPFHNGVFRIAQKAKRPIVVLATSGTERIHKRIFLGTDVHVDVVDVIPAEEVCRMRTDEIGERVRTVLEKALQDR